MKELILNMLNIIGIAEPVTNIALNMQTQQVSHNACA